MRAEETPRSRAGGHKTTPGGSAGAGWAAVARRAISTMRALKRSVKVAIMGTWVGTLMIGF